MKISQNQSNIIMLQTRLVNKHEMKIHYYKSKKAFQTQIYIYIYIYIYLVFTTDGFNEEAIESWHEWDLNPRPLILFRCSNRLSYQDMSSTQTQSQLCTATAISSFAFLNSPFYLIEDFYR